MIIGISVIVVLALAGFYVLGGARKVDGSYITDTVKRGLSRDAGGINASWPLTMRKKHRLRSR